ncbi:hypothetical protein HID58_040987 [Brassica napus]|uniref:C-type lectin domain-containing protein n=1 Tax=Brassica napus TaxID=3708 RepID=A0ABQ8B9K5_BRANA|nr:hypothetical protein HID58_040987 [Brassica napus]
METRSQSPLTISSLADDEPNCLSPSQRTQSSPTLSISHLADGELIWFIGEVTVITHGHRSFLLIIPKKRSYGHNKPSLTVTIQQAYHFVNSLLEFFFRLYPNKQHHITVNLQLSKNSRTIQLVYHGGKLVIIWYQWNRQREHKSNMLWPLWGKIDWCNVILDLVHKSYKLSSCQSSRGYDTMNCQ